MTDRPRVGTKSSIVFDDPRYDFTPNPRPVVLSHRPVVGPPPEPPLQKFVDAFLGKTPPGQLEEIRAITAPMAGANTVAGQIFNKTISVQCSQLKGLSVVKVGLGKNTPIDLVANPLTSFAFNLDITEGFEGSTFPLRTINVFPAVGMIIPVRGTSVTAKLECISGITDLILMSLAIVPEQATPGKQVVTAASGVVTPIPYFTEDFTCEPVGGVILGDTVDLMDASGVLLLTFAAATGARYVPTRLGLGVRYTPLGVAVGVIAIFNTNK